MPNNTVAKGYHNPDPCNLFIEDLIIHIKSLQNPDTKILVALATNKDASTLHPTKDLGKLLSQTSLIDLHCHWHPNLTTPLTYNCGQHTIDICLGTDTISQAVTGAWYLPFGQPDTLTGDHHTIGLDFEWRMLFGNTLPPRVLQIHCGVNSNAYPMVLEFSKMVVAACHQQNIYKTQNRSNSWSRCVWVGIRLT